MSQTWTLESSLARIDGGRRWHRVVALATAAVLTLLGLLAGAAPTASAAEPPGLVVGWGLDDLLAVPTALATNGATKIAVGSTHGLALALDGKLVTWGEGRFGLGDIPSSLADETVTAIAAGDRHSLALTSVGKVTAWVATNADYGQADVPTSLDGKTVTAIAAGSYHSLALTSDGKVTAWGENVSGEVDVPASLDDQTVTAIAAGGESSLAVTSDGRVTVWGANYEGQVDVPASLDSKTVTAMAASSGHILALTSDGTVAAWGDNGYGQTNVPGSLAGQTVTAIAAGSRHSLALTSDGKVTAWGIVGEERAEVPATLNRSTVTAIAAGGMDSVALATGVSPVVTRSPRSEKVIVGREYFFTATAAGIPAPTVQWQRADDGGAFEDLPGATSTTMFAFTGAASTTFTLTPVAADDGARFRAVFTNPYGSATTDTATLSLNHPPTVKDLKVTVGFESPTPVVLSGTDADGDALTYASLAQPEHGTLSGNAPTLTYTPDNGYSGPDSFTYVAYDGTENSADATVSITVTKKPNTAPSATNLQVTARFEAATPVTLAGTDADGDTLTYAVVAQPERGELSGEAPALTYTPNDGYSGDDSFTYRVNDGTASSATATVRLTVTPPPCTPAKPRRDFIVNTSRRDAVGAVRTPRFRTKKPGELMLAFVAADGSTTHPQSVTEVSGGGLTWTLVRRENTVRGTSEIWQAYAAKKIRSTRLEVDLATKAYSVTVTVAGFSRARPAAGSSAHASGTRSPPQVSLTPRATGSSVWAVGRVVGSRYHPEPVSGQKIVHDKTFRSPRAGYWTQRTRLTSQAGTDVTVRNKIQVASWGYVVVEIPGACR